MAAEILFLQSTVATWSSSTTPLLSSLVALAITAGERVLLRCGAAAAVVICAAEALWWLLVSQLVPEVDIFLYVVFLGKNIEMNEAPTGSGAIPLQEYRRDIPAGWRPGDASYPLTAYFDRLRLWYRICNLPDEAIGPTIAGRLYGRAHRVAMRISFKTFSGSFSRYRNEHLKDFSKYLLDRNKFVKNIKV